MARSAEAIQARAQKRNRSVAEQRRADSLQQQQQQQQSKIMMHGKRQTDDTTTMLQPPTTAKTNDDVTNKVLSPIMTINRHHDHVADDDHNAADANNTSASSALEPGAWTCPKCHNFNFASRRTCHSKTCDETRPAAATAAYYNSSNNNSATLFHQRRQPSFGKPRHDPATSKVVPWTAPPATKEQLEKNRELRQRYLDATAAIDKTTLAQDAPTNTSTTMTSEEIERARILVARDERKEQRRQEKRDRRQRWRDGTVKSEPALSTANTTTTPTIPAAKDKNRAQKLAEELRRERRRLRKLYLSTKGVGMKEDEIQRAKVLVARHEKKQRGKASSKE